MKSWWTMNKRKHKDNSTAALVLAEARFKEHIAQAERMLLEMRAEIAEVQEELAIRGLDADQ